MAQYQCSFVNTYGQNTRTDFGSLDQAERDFDFFRNQFTLTYLQLNDRDGNVVKQFVCQALNVEVEVHALF